MAEFSYPDARRLDLAEEISGHLVRDPYRWLEELDSAETRAWLAAHPRFHVHHTPKHASWLNQVEIFFSTLTRRVLRRGQFTSRDELAEKIDKFVLAYDQTDAKPYRWTYDGTPLKAA